MPVKRPPITPSKDRGLEGQIAGNKALLTEPDPHPESQGNADPQHQIDLLFPIALIAKQQRLELHRAAQNAGCRGGYAQLDQQIDENQALGHDNTEENVA